MLKDVDMRLRLLEQLNSANAGHDYRVIQELAVCDGEARVDVAVANGKLCGYEIKSDADTLERLPMQQKCYDKTFDTISIVVGKKYENIIEQYIPDYWGIFIISANLNGCKIKKKRNAKVNKNVEANALLELLWKDEIASLLKEYGIKGISGKNRRILRQLAVDELSLKIIRDYVRETLKSRKNWRT